MGDEHSKHLALAAAAAVGAIGLHALRRSTHQTYKSPKPHQPTATTPHAAPEHVQKKGHLFVSKGSVAALACDAYIVSCSINDDGTINLKPWYNLDNKLPGAKRLDDLRVAAECDPAFLSGKQKIWRVEPWPPPCYKMGFGETQLMDTNGDGFVDENEFLAAGGTKEEFDKHERGEDAVEQPQPYLVNVGNDFMSPELVGTFLEMVAADFSSKRTMYGRSQKLLGMVVAGATRTKDIGGAMKTLIPRLEAWVGSTGHDIALMCGFDTVLYSAVQEGRSTTSWPMLSAPLHLEARRLAEFVLKEDLVLFIGDTRYLTVSIVYCSRTNNELQLLILSEHQRSLVLCFWTFLGWRRLVFNLACCIVIFGVQGAGVSMGCGLPSWKSLLDAMARKADLTDSECDELRALDVLDQATVLRNRHP